MWKLYNNLAVWTETGRTEAFDKDALVLNIRRMEIRLATEPMNLLTRCMLEIHIERLNNGLKLLCNQT